MQVIELFKQMAYVIPSILVGTQTITAAIHGAFKITNKNWVHAISWIVAILAGVAFVGFNGLDFGVSTAWNYVLGGVCGLVVGGCANGVYDWPYIAKVFDSITNLFTWGKKQRFNGLAYGVEVVTLVFGASSPRPNRGTPTQGLIIKKV